MNLHNIVASAISAVNPHLAGSYAQSNGYTTSGDGTQVPAYLAPVPVSVQTQALQYKDLMQLQGLNINGEKRAMYISGNWEGVSRPEARGGDLITLTADGSVWLVVFVLENWFASAGWCKVAVTRQNS